jgi:hypothetical protein
MSFRNGIKRHPRVDAELQRTRVLTMTKCPVALPASPQVASGQADQQGQQTMIGERA